MQPNAPLEAETPISLDQVEPGTPVVDADGAQVGSVTAVQLPGTQVRPEVVVGIAESLMGSGYVRIDGTGFLSNDVYAGGDQIAALTPGEPAVLELRVPRDLLHRAAP